MKKSMLGKILIAVVAALVLSIALIACGGENQGGTGTGSEQQQGGAVGEDPLMEDGEQGKWNYTTQYVMDTVYGDAPQTNVAIQILAADGKFTCFQPDEGIIPFRDEWEEFMGEGTYTWGATTTDDDGYTHTEVTLELNGQKSTVDVVDDGFEIKFEIPATFFDPEAKNSYVMKETVISHADQTLTFLKY